MCVVRRWQRRAHVPKTAPGRPVTFLKDGVVASLKGPSHSLTVNARANHLGILREVDVLVQYVPYLLESNRIFLNYFFDPNSFSQYRIGLFCNVCFSCRCKPGICLPAHCEPPSVVNVTVKGDGSPGSCCDRFECSPASNHDSNDASAATQTRSQNKRIVSLILKIVSSYLCQQKIFSLEIWTRHPVRISTLKSATWIKTYRKDFFIAKVGHAWHWGICLRWSCFRRQRAKRRAAHTRESCTPRGRAGTLPHASSVSAGPASPSANACPAPVRQVPPFHFHSAIVYGFLIPNDNYTVWCWYF